MTPARRRPTACRATWLPVDRTGQAARVTRRTGADVARRGLAGHAVEAPQPAGPAPRDPRPDVSRRSGRAARWAWRVAATPLLVACPEVGAVVGRQLCTRPVDISGTGWVPPGWVNGIKTADEVAYPVHAWLGTAQNALGCDPAAAALQWLKAGAHVRSQAELGEVVQGLRSAAGRSVGRDELTAVICRSLARGIVRPAQTEALAQVGLGCP